MFIDPNSVPGVDKLHFSTALGRVKRFRCLASFNVPHNAEVDLFIMLHPFGCNRLSWPSQLSLQALNSIHQNNILFVFPESGRRWFIDDAEGKNYEQYIAFDLLEAVYSEYTHFDFKRKWIGGFSMGGAAAFFITAHHPNLFDGLFSFSGAFQANERQGDPYTEYRQQGILIPTEQEHRQVWGDMNSAVRNKYSSQNFVEKIKQQYPIPSIYLDIGQDDFLRMKTMNWHMHQLLLSNDVAHNYIESSGDHSWDYAMAAFKRVLTRYFS